MKRRLICTVTKLSIFLLALGCAANSIQDFEPKSPDEEAILSVFRRLEKVWNNHEAEGVLSLYHDDAMIMWGGLPGTLHTMEEYKEELPRLMADKVHFLQPTSIEISDNTAQVNIWNKLIFSSGMRKTLFQTWDFVKVNNQWLIIRFVYS